MLGSCCEVQEAREAEARARIKAATQFNEERMLKSHRLREEMQRSLRTACNCAECCGDCEEEEAEAPPPAPAGVRKRADGDGDDDSDSDFDEDAEEMAFIARMRAARMGEMRADATDASRRAARQGAHRRLNAGESLASLLSDPTDTSPIIVHLSAGEDDDTREAVEDTLRRTAADFPFARLVTVTCEDGHPPECRPFIREVPTLLAVERGLVSSVCDQLTATREVDAVRSLISQWLKVERERLAAAAAAAARPDDSDDEADDGDGSYCGIPGCKPYFHQHVQGQKRK